MKHLYIFIHVLPFILGIINLTLFLYNQKFYHKNLKIYIRMLICVNSFYFIDVFLIYYRKNVFYKYNQVRDIIFIAEIILFVWIIWNLMEFLKLNNEKIRKISTTITFKIILFLILLVSIISKKYFIGFVFFVFIIYKYIDNFDSHQKQIIRKILYIIGATIIIEVLTLIFAKGLITKLPFYPIIYFIVNFILFMDLKQKKMLISDKDNLECYNLTERELKIVELILAGYTNGSIGEYLDISSNTVKNHISNIYKKINVSNRYELMSIFK